MGQMWPVFIKFCWNTCPFVYKLPMAAFALQQQVSLWQRLNGPWHIKYLLFNPLWKIFANPYKWPMQKLRCHLWPSLESHILSDRIPLITQVTPPLISFGRGLEYQEVKIKGGHLRGWMPPLKFVCRYFCKDAWLLVWYSFFFLHY